MEVKKKSTRNPIYVALWVKEDTKALFVKTHAQRVVKGEKINHDQLLGELLKK